MSDETETRAALATAAEGVAGVRRLVPTLRSMGPGVLTGDDPSDHAVSLRRRGERTEIDIALIIDGTVAAREVCHRVQDAVKAALDEPARASARVEVTVLGVETE